MKIRGAPWKCRAVGNEENQNQVSLLSHRPWKSLRDSHIPTAPMMVPCENRTEKPKERSPAYYQPQFIPSGPSFD
jgi:hypothetical protein